MSINRVNKGKWFNNVIYLYAVFLQVPGLLQHGRLHQYQIVAVHHASKRSRRLPGWVISKYLLSPQVEEIYLQI